MIIKIIVPIIVRMPLLRSSGNINILWIKKSTDHSKGLIPLCLELSPALHT